MVLLVLVLSRSLMIIKNPDMARERAEAGQRENVKPWDRVLHPVTTIYGSLISWIIAGMDERFSWTPDLPDYIQVIALGVIFIADMLGVWAMLVNPIFSSHVHIQTDRGHTVVSTGPYRVVRHPGACRRHLGVDRGPVFFSSYCMAIPSVIMIVLNIIRIALEDRTLLEELMDYREYSEQMGYRLIPGVW